jgi:alpha-1,3-rhamnosyl/mannosyltransferase
MDLAFERVPDSFNARFRTFASHWHRRVATMATGVITPSEATAADARELWGVERITVAPLGPGQAPPPDRGEARHFLYVGDSEPRKNLDRLLAAYETYREGADEPLELVLAGSATAPSAPGVRIDPNPDLADLHRHAAALVLVSLHEGFGLPVLEALHAGTPVLASDIPALREVAADAARYADPYDTASIATALTELATVPPLREELRRRGSARAQHFSWERCARAHIAAYEAAVNLRRT